MATSLLQSPRLRTPLLPTLRSPKMMRGRVCQSWSSCRKHRATHRVLSHRKNRPGWRGKPRCTETSRSRAPNLHRVRSGTSDYVERHVAIWHRYPLSRSESCSTPRLTSSSSRLAYAVVTTGEECPSSLRVANPSSSGKLRPHTNGGWHGRPNWWAIRPH